MDAEEHHTRIFVENVLCAVAVMHVPVHQEYAVELVRRQGVVGGEGDVVEQAEAHAARRRGVMAGGANQAQGVDILAAHDGIDRGRAAPAAARATANESGETTVSGSSRPPPLAANSATRRTIRGACSRTTASSVIG